MVENDVGKTDPADASKTLPAPQAGGDPAAEAHILEEHIVAPPPQTQPMPPSQSSVTDIFLEKNSATPPRPSKPDSGLAEAHSASAPPESIQTPAPTRVAKAPAPMREISTLVLPEKPTPLKSDVSTALDRGEKNEIARILESVQLPQRREQEVPHKQPARVYDTSLAPDAKSAQEKEAAKLEALQTARAITEKLKPEERQGDVRAFHTLKDDLQNVVRDKKISLVRAVALEEEKRHHGITEEKPLEVQVAKAKRTRFAFFLAALLFIIGLSAIGAVLFIMRERTSNTAPPITAQVLFSEQSVPLPIEGLAPADIRREIGNARSSATLTLGAILQIVPILRKNVDGQSILAPASFGEFMSAIASGAPAELARALDDSFFLGLHTVDENAPIIVVPVTSYERAFAAMLEWEKNMNRDLSPMFTAVSMQAFGEGGIPQERRFEDSVMRNYDVRALKDDSGTVQLYYSFPTRNILIIAESPYSFSEILSRLRADRKL